MVGFTSNSHMVYETLKKKKQYHFLVFAALAQATHIPNVPKSCVYALNVLLYYTFGCFKKHVRNPSMYLYLVYVTLCNLSNRKHLINYTL